MGLYTEITKIDVPFEAEAGDKVSVTVKVKNTWTASQEIMIGGALDYGVSPWPTIKWSTKIKTVEAGHTASFHGSFTMPDSSLTVHAYSYYMGADGLWRYDDEATQAVALLAPPPPEEEPLPPPEDGSIFDDIFNWIANAITKIVGVVTSWVGNAWSAIVSTVTTWITWVWSSISPWLESFVDWFKSVRDTVVEWVTTQVGELWEWITTSLSNVITTVGAWFSEQWAKISDLLATWGENIASFFVYQAELISSYWSEWFKQRAEDWEAMQTWMEDSIVKPLATWWSQFLDRVFDVGKWIGGLLDGIAAWLMEDVPGHSPRWTAIFETIWEWFYKLFMRPLEIAEAPLHEQFTYSLDKLFGWIGDTFNTVFETFMDAIIGLVREIGPTNPSIALNSYTAMAKVGMTALGGLGAMTLAGSWLKPLGGAGMGNIAAMIYDMTNYKMITGVFMGALTFAMLRQPLTYYFNDIFRPFILRIGDFMELMARDAFSHPELLREPTLVTSVQELTQGKGTAFEQKMIGYYGYPAQYYGFFKELSYAPLRYFPLAGIARAGFWDEPWFTEALSRSGYSPTARAALMDMYREQVLTSRQLPVMYQVKRLSREGFATMEEIKAHLEKAAAMETLTETRLFAMELEQEFSQKEMAFDIILRSFSRGIISEGETRKGLTGLGIPAAMLDLHLTREKLGLLRRISIPTEAAAPALIGVEE
ncbi:hypothetical protein ES708_01446 [subsurface metagenome]